MAFYNPDPTMDQVLAALVAELEAAGRPGLAEQISITWLRSPTSLIERAARLEPGTAIASPLAGAGWGGGRPRYPASVVKLVYLVAVEAWLQRRLLVEGGELRRALEAMIRDSSNDATSLVVDLLSGTCSGPELPPERFAPWAAQRRLVNEWLTSLAWPQWAGGNACQKTWGDGPYGRERQFYGGDRSNRNRLATDFTARLLLAVIEGSIVSPPACARMRDLLERSLDPRMRAADPENQVDGFLGAGLPAGARLWSKAGWMSQARHDAAYVELEGGPSTLLVVFSEGPACAADDELLPAVAARLCRTF